LRFAARRASIVGMATQKESQRRLRAAIAAETKARAANRAANAEVSAAVAKLPPHYVTTADAKAQRDRVRPLVERAQKASNAWFAANADLVNARAAATGDHTRRRAPQRGSARGGTVAVLAAIGVGGALVLHRLRRRP
jgi:hypothetical protein